MRAYCERLIKSGAEARSELLNDVSKNPLNAVEWAQGKLESIAMGELASRVIDAIDNKGNMKTIIDHLRASVLRDAQYLNQSTSPLANHVKDIQKMVVAKFLDSIPFQVRSEIT